MKNQELKPTDYIAGRVSVNGDEEPGWLMKEFEHVGKDGAMNSVRLWSLDEGQAFDWSANGKRARVALHDCYVVEYMLNDTGNMHPFETMEDAMDFAMKIINLIKA